MTDPRFSKLAKVIVNYSLRLKRGEKVLIEVFDAPDTMAVEMLRAVRAVGAIPLIEVRRSRIQREIVRGSVKEHAQTLNDIELYRMKKMDAYVAIRGSDNVNESSDVPSDALSLYSTITRPIHNYRIDKTRWVVLRWPSPSMAQAAGQSTEAFEEFYFNVCTLDYKRMAKAMLPLYKRMKSADAVHLKGPSTDLRFSIKGIGAKMCEGLCNLPDGEVFSCPIKESVEGQIHFNAPSVYLGTRFENIRLVFKKGKIIEATSSDTKRMNQILDTDAGARYIGEFSLAFNPYILSPMGDILFDEKIAGSLHFTPGRAYEIAGNGNKSSVHWDMVLIQRPEWGGGEVWFDGELIRKNGKFLPKDLRGLNPENLK